MPIVIGWHSLTNSVTGFMVAFWPRKVSLRIPPVCCNGLSKVHKYEADYRRERDIYLRLEENSVLQIRGCNVPQLLRFNDAFFIIEMTVVRRPFLLDFAGAFLDQAPEFSDEVMADWLAEKREQFGARWPEVAAILRALEGMGIHYIDVSPKNISLPE